MAGWMDWLGKKVFINSRNSSHPYTGIVTDVDDSAKPLIFISIKDKFDKKVTFVSSEILMIKEDEK